MPQKVILDVDTGQDDAVALLLAGHHPALELVAALAVHGNAPLERTLDNTLRVLEHGKLEHVPVYPGAQEPLIGPVIKTHEIQYRTLPLPHANKKPEGKHAVQFLIDYYMSSDGLDTVYVPLGTHTNLALALRMEPRLRGRIPGIVTMAGAYIEGNTTPSAEFNVLADPEAAHIVFSSGIPITMVGLEVTGMARLTLEDIRPLHDIGTPWADVAALLMEADIRWFMDNLGWKAGEIYDACAVAALIDPSILQTRPMHVDIELGGQYTRGRTVADISGHRKLAPNVNVGMSIDRERFIQIILEGMR